MALCSNVADLLLIKASIWSSPLATLDTWRRNSGSPLAETQVTGMLSFSSGRCKAIFKA